MSSLVATVHRTQSEGDTANALSLGKTEIRIGPGVLMDIVVFGLQISRKKEVPERVQRHQY